MEQKQNPNNSHHPSNSSDPMETTSDGAPDRASTGRTGELASLVRHEERLAVGVQRVHTGRVTVSRRVVREVVTLEVEVQREEVVVHEEASAEGAGGLPLRSQDEEFSDPMVSDAGRSNRGLAQGEPSQGEPSAGGRPVPEGGPGYPAQEEEVLNWTLYAQRPVVSLETVPVEEVSIVRRTTSTTREVTAPVRREVVDVETDAGVEIRDGRPSAL